MLILNMFGKALNDSYDIESQRERFSKRGTDWSSNILMTPTLPVCVPVVPIQNCNYDLGTCWLFIFW